MSFILCLAWATSCAIEACRVLISALKPSILLLNSFICVSACVCMSLICVSVSAFTTSMSLVSCFCVWLILTSILFRSGFCDSFNAAASCSSLKNDLFAFSTSLTALSSLSSLFCSDSIIAWASARNCVICSLLSILIMSILLSAFVWMSSICFCVLVIFV